MGHCLKQIKDEIGQQSLNGLFLYLKEERFHQKETSFYLNFPMQHLEC